MLVPPASSSWNEWHSKNPIESRIFPDSSPIRPTQACGYHIRVLSQAKIFKSVCLAQLASFVPRTLFATRKQKVLGAGTRGSIQGFAEDPKPQASPKPIAKSLRLESTSRLTFVVLAGLRWERRARAQFIPCRRSEEGKFPPQHAPITFFQPPQIEQKASDSLEMSTVSPWWLHGGIKTDVRPGRILLAWSGVLDAAMTFDKLPRLSLFVHAIIEKILTAAKQTYHRISLLISSQFNPDSADKAREDQVHLRRI
ncbi:hypothetical protein CIRG_10083 [Coccidioides immitis RMSCC 2394]|uniref:Uncharacterized protein n=1 Tax=Coccidioides immitis RMSCC 2394 TaxID=404692 RepID=A0A0J6Y3E2_COCIT|nr:hypothetical protein CIRG_10083 [Coccidioides immitis RMSCC 2394]